MKAALGTPWMSPGNGTEKIVEIVCPGATPSQNLSSSTIERPMLTEGRESNSHWSYREHVHSERKLVAS